MIDALNRAEHSTPTTAMVEVRGCFKGQRRARDDVTAIIGQGGSSGVEGESTTREFQGSALAGKGKARDK